MQVGFVFILYFLEVAYREDTICLVFKLPRRNVMNAPAILKLVPFVGKQFYQLQLNASIEKLKFNNFIASATSGVFYDHE